MDDGFNPTCVSCSFECLSCSLLSNNCTNCSMDDHRKMFNISSEDEIVWTCICEDGFFPIPTSGTCSICHHSCSTCDNSNTCLSCNSSMHRVNGINNSCVCSTGYFDIGVEQCAPCHYSCLECSTIATNCLTCPPTRV